MVPSRSAHVRLTSTLLHFLLCFVIVMQMLGTTSSLWTLDFETDIVEASQLEGFSLTADVSIPQPLLTTSGSRELSHLFPSLLPEDRLFRPPHASRSTMSLV